MNSGSIIKFISAIASPPRASIGLVTNFGLFQSKEKRALAVDLLAFQLDGIGPCESSTVDKFTNQTLAAQLIVSFMA